MNESTPKADGATRVPIRFPVQILVGQEGLTILGTACAASRTGMRVLAPTAAAEPLSKGVVVQVSFTPGPKQLVESSGIVTSSTRSTDHRGAEAIAIEIEFSGLSGKMEATLRAFISQWRPAALLTGFDTTAGPTMHASLSMLANVAWAKSTDDVLRHLDAYDVAVLCIGPEIGGEAARELITRTVKEFPNSTTKNIVVAASSDQSNFAELIESGRVYYTSAASTPHAEVGLIAQNAVRQYIAESLDEPRSTSQELATDDLSHVVDLAEKLALQSDATSIGGVVFEALQDMVEADRAYFLVCDFDKAKLWSTDEGGATSQMPLAAGLVGFVARTGISVAIDDVSRDARYHHEADDPQGIGHERFIAEAVVAEGWADLDAYDPAASAAGRSSTVMVHREAVAPQKRVLAILVSVRDSARPMFSAQEQQLLRMVAAQVESAFSRIDMQQQLAQLSNEQEMLSQRKALRVFREEALEHYAKGQSRHGEVLRSQTPWMRWTYPVLLLVAVTALLFGIFGKVREYATGPAIVIIEGRTLVTAVDPATVADVWVRPGNRAKTSQILVSLHHDQELAEYNRIDRDYEAQLAKLLRDPSDKGAQQALLALKSQRVLAKRRLGERFLRAPHDGVIGDVRVRSGQRLSPGDIVLTMQAEQARYKLVGLLPGAYRPLLAKNMKLRLSLSGYPNASQDLVVASVGDGVISPNEARRYLGRGIGDAVKLGGSVFVVEAPLKGTTFTFQGHRHRFFDGMYGQAEVVVRSEPLLVKLIPGLKGLWGMK